MNKLTQLGLIALGVVVAGALFWHLWLVERYKLATFKHNDFISLYQLKAHPGRYLNRPIVLKGYLHRIRYINSGDVLLYPNKMEADIKNFSVAVPVAYPFDGKMVCNDHYVEVSGVFEALPENPGLGITFPIHGIGQVDYLGKIEDVVPFPGTGLRRASCPSAQLPDDHGVGTFRDSQGKLMDDPYKWTRGPGADEADQQGDPH